MLYLRKDVLFYKKEKKKDYITLDYINQGKGNRPETIDHLLYGSIHT